MNDAFKNLLIGLFVATATAIVIFLLLFLHPTVGDDGQILKVRFANIDKITVGTRVTYGGKPVGEVIEIQEIEDPKDARRPGKDGFVYLYELVLTTDTRVRVYNNDQVSAKTSGLLGEKSIEITPVPAKPGEEVFLVNDQVLYANENGSVEQAIKEFKELADKIEGTLDSIKFAVDELNRGKLWEKLIKTAGNLSDITTALNVPEKWTAIVDNIQEATKEAKEIAKNVHEVTKTVSEGKGTAGAILVKDDLYLRTNSILSKAETTIDDINHYGLLFQTDKRWQRLRARRANLITRLSSPQEFRNYFNDELDQITSSLGRLSMVLQDTESSDCYGSYMEDGEFRKVFAELMRRVIMMEESLKLYNTQVTERDYYQTELNRCGEQ